MAATAKYKISGTFDGKPIDEAKRGFKGVGDSMEAVKGIAGALAGALAIKEVVQFAGQCVTAFAAAELATKGLEFAVKASSTATSGAADRLEDFARAASEMTGVNENVYIGLERTALATGRTEEQTRKLISASMDFAAGTGKDINEIFLQLNKSFGGYAGELGEAIPSVKALTAEQLKAGGAIDLVAKQYEGFSESLSETMDVKIKKAGNSWTNFTESLGKVFSSVFSPVIDWFTTQLDGITKAIDDAARKAELSTKIAAGTATKDERYESYMLESERLFALLQKQKEAYAKSLIAGEGGGVGPAPFVETSRGGYVRVTEDLIAITKAAYDAAIKELSKASGERAAALKKETEDKAETAAAAKKREESEARTAIYQKNLDALEAFSSGIEAEKRAWEERLRLGLAEETAMYEDFYGKQVDLFKLVDGMAKTDTGKALGEAGSALLAKLYERLERLAAPVGTAYEAIIKEGMLAALDETTLPEDISDEIKKPPKMQFGEPKGDPSNTKGGGGSNETGGAVTNFWGAVWEIIKSMEVVQRVFGWLREVVGAMFEVIAPALDSILRPLFGILKVIGATVGAMLGPALEALSPVIDLLATAFVWLYNNAIMPVANLFIYLGRVIENVSIWFHNLFSGWWDQLAYKDLNDQSGYLQAIEMGTVSNAGGASAYGGGGGSASYTAARDVIVNIYYDRSYINGDAQAIALDIYKTIKSAQALGVA